MCDVFICSDSGVGLCEDDRKILEGLGADRKISFRESSGESKSSTERFGLDDSTRSDDTKGSVGKGCKDRKSICDKDASVALNISVDKSDSVGAVKAGSDKAEETEKQDCYNEESIIKQCDNNNNVEQETNRNEEGRESMEKQIGCAGKLVQYNVMSFLLSCNIYLI